MGLDLTDVMPTAPPVASAVLAIGGTPDPRLFDAAWRVVHATGCAGAVERLLDERFDCVLLDLADASGLAAIEQVRTAALDVPVIVVCDRADEALAVQSVREGAQDFLVRGSLDARGLRLAVSLAIERKSVETRLAHEALHDDLTGLPHRELFIARLGQALSRLGRHSTTLSVLFLDLDRFKAVNDQLGHAAGDELLRAVGARLHGVLRAGDTAARLGGDEFAVFCEDVAGERHAIGVAERIVHELRSPFRLSMDEVTVGVSIGIALATTGREHPEVLVREADAAMYRAKEHGEWFEVFDDGMRERATHRRRTEDSLRRALDRGELAVRFLPQVELATGAVCGAEALVRWDDPERGLIGPGDFIATAEETGLILPIGAWVLEEACRHAVRWPGFPTAVNLSSRQSAQPDLVDVV